MPRLGQVARDDVGDEAIQRMYQQMFGDRDPVVEPGTATGSPGNWWTVFANAPDVLRHAVRGFALYSGGRLELRPDLRELGQTRAGWAVGSQFVFSQHCKSCRAFGVSDEKVDAIPNWQIAECFDGDERAVLAYTDCLVLQQGRVPDALFDDLRRRFSDREILELTYVTCMYLMHATMAKALHLEFDDRDDPVTEVAAPEGFDVQDIGSSISGGSGAR